VKLVEPDSVVASIIEVHALLFWLATDVMFPDGNNCQECFLLLVSLWSDPSGGSWITYLFRQHRLREAQLWIRAQPAHQNGLRSLVVFCKSVHLGVGQVVIIGML
jgi:hypothetical protein